MTEGLKERPALLRRTPRPAPDEKVDPVDYSPGAVAPVPDPAPSAEASPASGGVEPASTPVVAAPVQAPTVQPAVPAQEAPDATPVAAPAPARQSARTTKAAKSPANKKTSRREVTFPLSTRLSEEVMNILYTASDEEGISVREAIEQGIRSRWG
jgi:hypothetical protein